MKAVFNTKDPSHENRNGMTVDVIMELDKVAAKILNAEAVYEVEFPDGFVLYALDDDLLFLPAGGTA